MSVKHMSRRRELEVVGVSLPLKYMLNIEGSSGRVAAMDALLGDKAVDVKKAVFGDGVIDTYTFQDHVRDGTLNPEYNKNGRREGYFRQLAYHIFVKAPVLDIASDCGVVVTANPVGDIMDIPLECVIAPKRDGEKRISEFICRVGDFMDGEVGVPLTQITEIRDGNVRMHSNLPISSAGSLLVDPVKFRPNLELQTPPEIHDPLTRADVKRMREFFNEWYRRNPLKMQGLIEELVSAPRQKDVRSHIEAALGMDKIPVTIHVSDYPAYLRERYLKNRI
ncbi:MAG: hypothetical protein ABH834_00565 [Candidatus Altiarchaeota archaeon]